MAAKTATILDKRKIKKNDTYPVKLRITFERKQQYYPIPFEFTEDEFDKIMYGTRHTHTEKINKAKIASYENKAISIINALPVFSFIAFEKKYFVNSGTKGTLNSAFAEYSAELRDAARIGSAVAYETAQGSLNRFMPGAKFSDITPDSLRKYEKWMLDDGKSVTTVGIYLRSLRAIFNNAIEDGILTKDYYPFGKKKYEIPTSNNIKKALTLKDIASIYNYKPEPQTMTDRAKDYWIFMYLCNGMNMKDMCLLTYDNIKGDVLQFVRAKTMRTKRKVEPIRVVYSNEVHAIVQKWGNEMINGSTYIFPILEKNCTPVRERQLIQQITHVVNAHMRKVADALEIKESLNTYTCRHSFSTVLQRSGVGTEFISEALGHSSVKTTAGYLAGFEDDKKKETAKMLTDFAKI